MTTLAHSILRAALPALTLLASVAHAEMRTLTDTQGRTIQADVMGVDGDNVKIRRADGQIFDLPMDRLVQADQRALRAWAKEQASKPQPLPAGAFQVHMSRARFSTETTESDVRLTDGTTRKNARITTEEKWGFGLILNNRTSAPLENLRAEYILYATMDDVHKDGKKEGLRQARYGVKLDPVPAQGRLDFRTDSVSVSKMRYKGNIVSAATGDNRSRESLHGIWIRIYRGDEIIYEEASPGTLMRTEKW